LKTSVFITVSGDRVAFVVIYRRIINTAVIINMEIRITNRFFFQLGKKPPFNAFDYNCLFSIYVKLANMITINQNHFFAGSIIMPGN
jgi:hypothetical protein